MYGSSFMRETETPRFFSSRPREATLIPFPTDDATPPVTKMNLDMQSSYRSLDTRGYGTVGPPSWVTATPSCIPSRGATKRPLSEIWHPPGVPLHFLLLSSSPPGHQKQRSSCLPGRNKDSFLTCF